MSPDERTSRYWKRRREQKTAILQALKVPRGFSGETSRKISVDEMMQFCVDHDPTKCWGGQAPRDQAYTEEADFDHKVNDRFYRMNDLIWNTYQRLAREGRFADLKALKELAGVKFHGGINEDILSYLYSQYKKEGEEEHGS